MTMGVARFRCYTPIPSCEHSVAAKSYRNGVRIRTGFVTTTWLSLVSVIKLRRPHTGSSPRQSFTPHHTTPTPGSGCATNDNTQE